MRNRLPHYGTPEALPGIPVSIEVDRSRLGGDARSTVGTATDIEPLPASSSRAGTLHVGVDRCAHAGTNWPKVPHFRLRQGRTIRKFATLGRS